MKGALKAKFSKGDIQCGFSDFYREKVLNHSARYPYQQFYTGLVKLSTF